MHQNDKIEFKLLYMSFNEWGGIVQSSIKIKASTLEAAKEKLRGIKDDIWGIKLAS